jgi:hypothetical protein
MPARWTAHPQHFRQSGYLVMGTGKVWHTEVNVDSQSW